MKSNIFQPSFLHPVHSPEMTANVQAFEFKFSNDYLHTSKQYTSISCLFLTSSNICWLLAYIGQERPRLSCLYYPHLSIPTVSDLYVVYFWVILLDNVMILVLYLYLYFLFYPYISLFYSSFANFHFISSIP